MAGRVKQVMRGVKAGERQRAAVYTRVSTAGQADDDKVSLSEQLADCEAYCAAKGYEVVVRYSDVKSGATSKRPDFQRLLQDAEAGAFDVVVCWKVDRISRGLFAMARLLEVIDPKGITIEAVREQIDQRYLGLLASVGKLELDGIRERTMTMRRAYARQGYVPASVLAYGYRKGEDGKPELHPDEAPILLEAGQRYADGELPVRIAEDFRRRGVPTRRPNDVKHGAWQPGYLNRLFRQEGYASGAFTYGGETVPHPPLFPPGLWQRIQARRDQNTVRAARNTKGEYLLQHLLYCTECETAFAVTRRLSYIRQRKSGPVTYAYKTPQTRYRCMGAHMYRRRCRPGATINSAKTDQRVWDALVAALHEPDVLLAGVRARLAALQTQAEGADLNEADRMLARLKVERLEIARQRVQGKIDDATLDLLLAENATQTTYWTTRAAADARLRDDLDAQRCVLEQATGYLEDLRTRVRGRLAAMSFAERRTLVLALVDRVWVDGQNRLTVEGIIGTSRTASASSASATDSQKGTDPHGGTDSQVSISNNASETAPPLLAFSLQA